jgi:hypothetical protein
VAGGGVDVSKRLDPRQACKLVRAARLNGKVAFSNHALEEMKNDELIETDVDNVLCCGTVYDEPRREAGSWRYRVETERICVVVAFWSPTEVVVVTAWRKKGRGQ